MDACGGLWDVGEPKDVAITPIYVAANAPQGRWQGRNKTSRLPVVCKTDACVQGAVYSASTSNIVSQCGVVVDRFYKSL